MRPPAQVVRDVVKGASQLPLHLKKQEGAIAASPSAACCTPHLGAAGGRRDASRNLMGELDHTSALMVPDACTECICTTYVYECNYHPWSSTLSKLLTFWTTREHEPGRSGISASLYPPHGHQYPRSIHVAMQQPARIRFVMDG